jgi:hypothetical protein
MVPMVLWVSRASSSGQTPAPAARDGVITGQVVDATTGKPVSAVVVSMSGGPIFVREYGSGVPSLAVRSGLVNSTGVPRILTGADGRFLFRDLPMGSFTITATKGGYAEGASGRRRPGGDARPVVLADAQRTMDVVVRVWKNAVITGTVTDEAGEPVVGLQVRALARTASLGNQSDPTGFVRVGVRPFTPIATPALTDDRGVYRFANLTPGDYIVVAAPPLVSAKPGVFNEVARTGRGTGELLALTGGSGAATPMQMRGALLSVGRGAPLPPPAQGGSLQIYPPTFYPSAAMPGQASSITLASGEERAGVDIHLMPAPTARVSGTLMSAAGPLPMTSLRLLPAGADGIPPDFVAPASVSDGAGDFVFVAVLPGRYSLRGSTPGGAAGMAWVDMPVTVAGDDIDGVVAMMNPALRITGRLQFDGNTPPPVSSSPDRPVMTVPFILDPADAASAPDQLSVAIAGGERGFVVTGYRPGRYRVRVPNSPSGWMFKAAMLNGVDVSETPFELTRDVADLVLTFTDRWSGVGGVVQGTGSDGAAVFVFPTEAQKWTSGGASPRRLRATRANARGQFGLSSLPPGDYYVVAVQEEPAGDWRDPATLEALARVATQVAIAEGEHKTIDLRVREVRQ